MNKFWFVLTIFLFNSFCLADEKLPYNFSDTNYTTIKLSPIKEIASDREIYEGEIIKLKLRNNIYCHDTLLAKKGTIATARIETIVTKGMNGFPAEIILGDFNIEGIEQSHLMGEYIKTGRNWALMVYPIKWALTPIPFVGSLTNLIKGGEARIETDDIIKIKYYPHWS